MPLSTYLNSAKMQLGLPANKFFYSPYFDSLVILAIFFILSKLVVFVSKKIILSLTKKTRTNIDDLIVKNTNKPLSFILLLIGIRLALYPLSIRQPWLDMAEHIISSLIVVLLTYIAIVVIDILIENWFSKLAEKTESTLDDELLPVIENFFRIISVITCILVILSIWGVEIAPLLASLGIIGIAVAFALQSTLGNIFGGMSIILDKSVKVGDKIKLDQDTMGTVLRIGLRSTKILTFDNELITIPSGKLADSRILNFLQPNPIVRAAIDFGVEYGSDTSKVRKIVLDEIKKVPHVLKEPEPKVLMIEMGDFSLKFRVLFWVEEFDKKFDTKALATEEIYNALRKAGIGIPFPTRTVYLKNGK
ncbi:mechanosensitive ion channel [Candidatus Woesearchaeota archaeon]|nr:mechanosensitive ion channel [Candidatus Woesearchaeota archaeon]